MKKCVLFLEKSVEGRCWNILLINNSCRPQFANTACKSNFPKKKIIKITNHLAGLHSIPLYLFINCFIVYDIVFNLTHSLCLLGRGAVVVVVVVVVVDAETDLSNSSNKNITPYNNKVNNPFKLTFDRIN